MSNARRPLAVVSLAVRPRRPTGPDADPRHRRRTRPAGAVTAADRCTIADAARATSRSIRATTSCSRRRPAPGKTRVLVDRYVNLLRAGVDPGNILAITFTRKAAAEMRERIVATLRGAAEHVASSTRRAGASCAIALGDIAISTIDAFCLSLLREFPLEADLDPGFDVADETEVPRLVDEALDRALRICRGRRDATTRTWRSCSRSSASARLRDGLAALLDRRLVAPGRAATVPRARARAT